MEWTCNYHHTDKCNRPMVGLHKYLISLLFCWQAKLPDIEKCLDIVAALQAKKALGEVFPVSEKPNYLLLHFLSWYCTIVEGCTLALRRTKCYSFDALHGLLVILPYLKALGYYSVGLCLHFCYPENVALEPMTIFQIVLSIKRFYLPTFMQLLTMYCAQLWCSCHYVGVAINVA